MKILTYQPGTGNPIVTEAKDVAILLDEDGEKTWKISVEDGALIVSCVSALMAPILVRPESGSRVGIIRASDVRPAETA